MKRACSIGLTKSVLGRIDGIDRELQDVFLVPFAFGVNHDTSVRNLGREVTAQTFQVLGSRFDGDHLGRARR